MWEKNKEIAQADLDVLETKMNKISYTIYVILTFEFFVSQVLVFVMFANEKKKNVIIHK